MATDRVTLRNDNLPSHVVAARYSGTICGAGKVAMSGTQRKRGREQEPIIILI